MQSNLIPMFVRPASSNIMHNKFMVIDDQIVIAGSMNYSETDVMKNNNHTLFIKDELLASQYTFEFNQMANGLFGTRKIQALNNMDIQTSKANMRAYFGPKDDLLGAILRNLQGTPKRVYFMIFSFTHPQISARLLELKAMGTEIIGIFDEGQASNQYSQDETLALAGIPIAFDGNENNIGFAGGKLHHKTMLIEYESEKIILAGSYNWSKAASQANDENLIQLKGIDPFKSFGKEFCRRWDEAILHPQSTPYQQEPPLCIELRTPPLVKVQIQAALPDPTGKDLGQEYVVIKNVGNVAVDLSNWQLGDFQSDRRHVFAAGSFLNVNASLKIYDRGSYQDGISSSTGTLSLNNTGDVIRLLTNQNTEMDRWEYLEPSVREGVEMSR
jgi:phosphatidylserine/phosphatidylglycerophosphate/cardiolipin synthase-like enzyme